MTVTVTPHDRIRVLTLARPPANALERTLIEAITREVVDAARDDTCRGVVLTGGGGFFSAGVDIKVVPTYAPHERKSMLLAINRMVLELYSLTKPMVAAVNGHAIGGGLVLALTADVRLAATGSYGLGLTEAAAGIPFPAGPLAVVEAELPPHTRRQLCLTARTVAPEDPLLIPAIDRWLAPERLMDEAMTEVEALVKLPGHRAVKRQLRAATVRRLREIVEQEDEPLLAQKTKPSQA